MNVVGGSLTLEVSIPGEPTHQPQLHPVSEFSRNLPP